MIQELANFRKKYPQYGDVDDTSLAGMLAKKYPDAYGDLPGKLSPTMQMQPSHYPVENLQQPQPWKQAVSNTARTVFPAAGGVIGGVLGAGAGATTGPAAPVGIPTGAVAGGALGAGIGMQGADVLDEWLGIKAPAANLPEAALQAAHNVYTGAQGEALGLGLSAAPAAISRGIKATGIPRAIGDMLGDLKSGVSDKSAAGQVQELLEQFQRTGDQASLAEAQELSKRIPGFQNTLGTATGNRGILSLERSAASGGAGKPGFEEVPQRIEDLLQGNVEAVRGKLGTLAKGNPDNLLAEATKQRGAIEAGRETLAGADRAAGGRAVTSGIDKAKEPVRQTLNRLEGLIPKYPVNIEPFKANVAEILSNAKLSPYAAEDVRKVAGTVAKHMKDNGNNTFAIMGARRAIDDMYEKVHPSAQPLLLQMKRALDSEVENVASMARTGKLATFQGKPVFPDQLAAEMEESIVKLGKLNAEQMPDMATAIDRMRKAGLPVMQQMGENPAAFAARMAKDYARKFGEDVPLVSTGNTKEAAALEERIKQIQGILKETSPGQDVAAAMRAYNEYAADQWHGRFGADSIKGAGRAQYDDTVTRAFATETGADDLIKAIGKDNASVAMRPHFQRELGEFLAKDPNDQAMTNWLFRNRRQLGKLGIYDEFAKEVKSQQGAKELAKIIKLDNPASFFDSLMAGGARQQRSSLDPIISRISGNKKAMEGLKAALVKHLDSKLVKTLSADKTSFANATKELEKLQPTIDRLFTPAERQVLNDVRRAINMTQKLTSGPTIGGSQTQELLEAGKRLTEGRRKTPWLDNFVAAAVGAGTALANPYVAAPVAIGVKTIREATRKSGEEAVRRAFVSAMFDPEAAKVVKRTAEMPQSKQAASDFMRLVQRGVAYSTAANLAISPEQEEPPSE